MRTFLRRHAWLIELVLGLAVTAATASDLVGRTARAVDLVAIGAGMFGAGLGWGRWAALRRGGRPGRH